MKKFILGILVGITVTAAGSAYAEEIESVIGKAIQGQFPVKIQGKQLDKQAVVVDGTSYLPVRAIGEALNMDVKFDADLGIELIEKGGKAVTTPQQTPTTEPEQPTMTMEEIADKIDFYKIQIKISNTNIEELTILLTNKPEEADKTQKLIDDQMSRIADYEAQIAALEAQQ